ncbi:hypothetical protein SAMN04489747_2779 [Auraticoccus monumenti]|uniref:Uncharacterized protein n=1 Tax=Auraticoccus monumenti TaxID=675864 RepID=A0A1G7AZW0_9ACTN|nr:hypothetical protein SAMN04489747_2779 [Auraticoccus monumenti]
MLVSVLGGLLVLSLVLVNVAVLVDGPSRRERMRIPNEVGVSPGQYHDAWGATLDADGALTRVDRATSSYLTALPIGDGTEVVNGADHLAQLDRSVADLAASPARQDPAFEALHTTWTREVEQYRGSQATFLEATTEAAPVLETCNPHALPVHTPREQSSTTVLRGCGEDLDALGETGDPTLDAILAEARPYLAEWADAVEEDPAAVEAARDGYISAFVEGTARADQELDRADDPVQEARAALADYAEERSEPSR